MKTYQTSFDKFPYLDSRLYDRDAGVGTMLKVAQGNASTNAPTKKLTEPEIQTLVSSNVINVEYIKPKYEGSDMKAALIREKCGGRSKGDYEVVVYDRLIDFYCADPLDYEKCARFEQYYSKGEFVSRKSYFITRQEYNDDAFWVNGKSPKSTTH